MVDSPSFLFCGLGVPALGLPAGNAQSRTVAAFSSQFGIILTKILVKNSKNAKLDTCHAKLDQNLALNKRIFCKIYAKSLLRGARINKKTRPLPREKGRAAVFVAWMGCVPSGDFL
jgi:hypothetical protein